MRHQVYGRAVITSAARPEDSSVGGRLPPRLTGLVLALAVQLALVVSNPGRQREVADGIGARVRAEREKAVVVPDDQGQGTEPARDA